MSYSLILALFLAFIALAAYIRLAPSDPTIWNATVADATVATPGPCAGKIITVPKGARATCLLSADPATVLTKLDTIARATPRVTLLAGSPEQGRMTWVSRSQMMGFPDYITAQVAQTPQGTRLDILSRLRFGQRDFGVNAARLRLWLSALDQG